MGQAKSGGRSALRDAIRTQLWPIPAFGIAVAAVLGILLPELDSWIDDSLPPSVSAYLFGGGAQAARAVLEAIAGSLITVTSLTFSLTVVTLQLASSQFSPRLLRTFSSDRFVQATLALFLGTFTYALTVLRTVRTPADDQILFVPQIAVTVAFLLAVASVFGLVVFLAHLAKQIRVETMLVNVHQDATQTLRRILPPGDADNPSARIPEPPPDAATVPAPASGFLVWLDEPALLAAAREASAVLMIHRAPGNSLVAGTPIGVAWPLAGHYFDEEVLAELRHRAAEAVHTGPERTAAQDVGFGLRQLTDVATKALSPGINDPTTAIHAIGHSSALLVELAARDLAPRVLHDQDHTVRVVLHRSAFADLLDTAISQPRRYGAADPAVLTRLLWLLREVAWNAKLPEQRQAVAGQLARINATIGQQQFDATETNELSRLSDQVTQALAGDWTEP